MHTYLISSIEKKPSFVPSYSAVPERELYHLRDSEAMQKTTGNQGSRLKCRCSHDRYGNDDGSHHGHDREGEMVL